MKLKRAEWYEVPHYWPQVETLVASALRHGGIGFRPEDIYRGLLSRGMQLWLALDGEAIRAMAVTHIQVYPRARTCVVMLVGGTGIDRWIDFEADLCAWAVSQGCVAMEGLGRRGWGRKVADQGWREVWILYRKRLDAVKD